MGHSVARRDFRQQFSHGDDDLSSGKTLRLISESRRDLVQRIGPIDNRFHRAGFEKLGQEGHIVPV